MTIIFEAMELKDSTRLLNIEGRVYRLSKKDYEHFHKEREVAFNESNTRFVSDSTDAWSELLHWVEENGKYVCSVESFNY